MVTDTAWATAERDTIGAMLASAPLRALGLDLLDPTDFHDTHCSQVFAALQRLHARGTKIDRNVVASEAAVPTNWLLTIIVGTPPTMNVEHWATIVRDGAVCRRALAHAAALTEAARSWDAHNVLHVLEQASQVPSTGHGLEAAEDALELSRIEHEYRWLIPGLLERTERVMVVGGEGSGKSLLLRQFGVCVASGIHPWSHTRIARQRVLIIDLENTREQVARSLRRLMGRAGERYQPGYCQIRCRPQGMDLTHPRDARWLDAVLEHDQPDLVIFGSLYKAYRGSDGRSKASEEAAELVASAIDDLRVRHDCAWMIEAHAPHGDGGDRAGWRPAGSSLWLRWPEMGFGLGKPGPDGTVEMKEWRGSRDRERRAAWPSRLRQGDTWPWMRAD